TPPAPARVHTLRLHDALPLYDRRNTNHIAESHSQYRLARMEELIGNQPQLNPGKMASILRNRDGLKDIPLGYGNEKALNQLLAQDRKSTRLNSSHVKISYAVV